ncbi:MAG: lysylphosphatidylglycerol synthase domain-containing protein, partial [Thermomicrobium sp.]|nr:lysylphosphatidylglycerol synthase domain-containing protein [Thermomicrobium sp.]
VASVVGLLLLEVRVPLDELARVLGRWGVAVALAAFVLGVVILLGVPMAWRHGSSRVCRGLWQSWVVVGRVSRDPVVWAATAGRWGAEFLLLTLLVQASGLSLSASAIVTLIGVSSFIGLVAPVPGGLGAREAAGVVLATAYGWSPVGVGAVLVWYRIAAVIGLAVVGVGSALAWRWMRCGG